MLRICSFFVLVAICGVAGAGERLTGPAIVVDGDTLRIWGATVRIFGIDAPEAGQPCRSAEGVSRDCGAMATAALARLVSGRTVSCTPLDRDRYGRIVARCDAGSGDLGRIMVEEGWALAFRRFSRDYDLAEKGAFVAGRGRIRRVRGCPAAGNRGCQP